MENARTFYNIKYASHCDDWVNRYALLSISVLFPRKLHPMILMAELKLLFDMKQITLDINTD
jgi:hypothetical protein